MPIGAHVSFISSSVFQTVQSALHQGMNAAQFFLGNPKSCQRARPTEQDLSKTKAILSAVPLQVFTHFPYVANLAGSVAQLAWNGHCNQDQKTKEVLLSLEKELEIVSTFGGKGVIIHPGAFPDRQKGLETIAQSLDKLKFAPNSFLLLENSAGQGNSLATTFEEIQTILEGMTNIENKKHIKVCIDTCHTFAYGLYDLRNVEEVDRMFEEFEQLFGIGCLGLIHLNDSVEAFKSRKDRHACLGEGCIWKDDNSALLHLFSICKEKGISMVMETEVSDMDYVFAL